MYVDDQNTKATTSMILGVLALVFSWIPVIGLVSWPLAILGLVFGLTSRKHPQPGYRTTGIVTNSLALVVCVIWAGWFVYYLTQYPF